MDRPATTRMAVDLFFSLSICIQLQVWRAVHLLRHTRLEPTFAWNITPLWNPEQWLTSDAILETWTGIWPQIHLKFFREMFPLRGRRME